MKVITALLLFLLFQSACTTLPPKPPTPDVVITHLDGTTKEYFADPKEDDLERGKTLREAVKELKDGETITLGKGKFDLNCPTYGGLLFPDKIIANGAGRSETHLRCDMWSDAQGLGFEVRSGNYSNLTFETQSSANFEDARTIGVWEGLGKEGGKYQHDESGNKVVLEQWPGPYEVKFEDVELIGNDWVWYNWSNRHPSGVPHKINFTRVKCKSGRQCFSLMNNNDSHEVTIIDSEIDIDSMRSNSVGWTSKPGLAHGGCYGVVARGMGPTIIRNTKFNIKCGETPYEYSVVDNAACVFDGHNFGSISSQRTKIEMTGSACNMNSTSQYTYDLLMSNEGAITNLKLSDNLGSGPEGQLTKSWDN